MAKKDDTGKVGMITVSNGEAIVLMVNSIFTVRTLPVKDRYWLSRIADKLQGIAKFATREREKIILENCIKDEKGKPILKNGKNYTFDPPEREAEANRIISDLMAIENTLPWPRLVIDLAAVPEGFELSASEMASARPVVEFVFEEKNPK